ncbi:hypothetical protein PsorP6_008898 [Peronosclerospora sorghi]|uniref:Uncharacterized protein n=1 Tax=Peronosclerospora sorghi TaxID=230839 RepID=A0ACC0VXN5_9STRA|nr:hypothetical protein PsorP6_008898 [Peronosclerospora sorghi]
MSLVTSAPGRGYPMRAQAVRIQELSQVSDESSRNSSQRTQPPTIETASPDLASSCYELTTDKRCGNKRALLASTPATKRRDGEVVEVKGFLLVAIQVDRSLAQPVFRTLGSIYCVLVRKREALFLETVSRDRHLTMMLNVSAMDLVHDPLKSDRRFQLRCRPNEMMESTSGLRAHSYVFMAPTKEEYDEWLDGIIEHPTSGTIRERGSSEKETVTDSGSIVFGSDESTNTISVKQELLPSVRGFMYTTPPRTKHFILVRHGHYVNAHIPQVPDSQQVLSQMGRQQAELTGKYLGVAHNRMPTRHDVFIYHSDMTRAVETATILAADFGEVSLSASSLLREGWPGTPYSTNYGLCGTPIARNNRAMEELAKVDKERMGKAFNEFFTDPTKTQDENNEESYSILVCHANLIRYFLCRALGVDPATTWGHFEINHCSVTRIDVCAHRPIKIIAVNETGHLPQSLITSSEDHL